VTWCRECVVLMQQAFLQCYECQSCCKVGRSICGMLWGGLSRQVCSQVEADVSGVLWRQTSVDDCVVYGGVSTGVLRRQADKDNMVRWRPDAVWLLPLLQQCMTQMPGVRYPPWVGVQSLAHTGRACLMFLITQHSSSAAHERVFGQAHSVTLWARHSVWFYPRLNVSLLFSNRRTHTGSVVCVSVTE
jgi:hypothetical protein